MPEFIQFGIYTFADHIAFGGQRRRIGVQVPANPFPYLQAGIKLFGRFLKPFIFNQRGHVLQCFY